MKIHLTERDGLSLWCPCILYGKTQERKTGEKNTFLCFKKVQGLSSPAQLLGLQFRDPSVSGSYLGQANYLLGAKFQHQLACTSFQTPWLIETSYSKHHKELARLADEYISGSNGNIAVILGLDIEYGVGSRTASLSIWRPRLLPDPDEKEAVLLETFSVASLFP